MLRPPRVRSTTSAPLAMLAALAALPGAARADADEDGGGEEEYADQGNVEAGGRIAVDWTEDRRSFTASPTIGYFVADRYELSLSFDATYTRTEDPETGDDVTAKRGAIVFEPSYHHPIHDDLFVQLGLGLGAGYDGTDPDLEVIPHLGLNIASLGSAVVTPGVRVPILYGDGHGDGDGAGTDVGVVVDVGITSSF